MTRIDLRLSLPCALQCLLAASVFSVFLLAQVFAYLLYLYPRSEWLWFLSVGFNRDAAPFLEIFDKVFPLHPLASCAVLAGFCVAPLVSYMKRNWLGISALGHVALFAALWPVTLAILEGDANSASASLSGMADLASRNINTGLWLVAVAALLPLCVFNHAIFFRGFGRRISE